MNFKVILFVFILITFSVDADACDGHVSGLSFLRTCEGKSDYDGARAPDVQIEICGVQLMMYASGVLDESIRQGKPRKSCRENKWPMPGEFVDFMKTRKDLWRVEAPKAIEAFIYCM